MLSLRKIVPVKKNVKRFIRNVHETIKYKIKGNQFTRTHINHVVFVCKGNICRSAFAEFYLKSKVNELIKVESCGIEVDKEMPSPHDAIQVSKEFNVDLKHHMSKDLRSCNLEDADIIACMEYFHVESVLGKFPNFKNKTVLLRQFSSWNNRILLNIDDPYEGGYQTYKKCFQIITNAIDRMYKV